MKPNFFQRPEELMQYISRLPCPDGIAKVQGEDLETRQILEKLLRLAPQMFEYKAVLAKGAGGLGSNKSVFRYADAAADNVSQEKILEYETSIASVTLEVDSLIEAGASQELAENLRQARTQAARFRLIKNTIDGFHVKLNKYMQIVEDKYSDLQIHLATKRRDLSSAIGEERVSLLQHEIIQKHQVVVQLMESMASYCDLQIAYNGIWLGAKRG